MQGHTNGELNYRSNFKELSDWCMHCKSLRQFLDKIIQVKRIVQVLNIVGKGCDSSVNKL